MNWLLFLYSETVCQNVTFLKIIIFIKYLLNIVFWIIPIGLIVIVSFDMFRAFMAKRDDMDKHLKLSVKRIIYAVCIFLIYNIVGLVMGIINDSLGEDNVYLDCLNVSESSLDDIIAQNKERCDSDENKEDNWVWDDTTDTCIKNAKTGSSVFKTPESITVKEKKYNEGSGSNSSSGVNLGGIQTEEEAQALEKTIEEEWLHTQIHYKTTKYQSGPFIKYWSSADDYNSLGKFQCTWWANGRASMYLEQYGTKYKKYPTQSGHGKDYYENNKENGWFEYGQTPRANSIISWSGEEYGHVAYVEGVTSDGIWISDAGSGENWRGVHKIGLDGIEWKSYPLNGYIYLDSPK